MIVYFSICLIVTLTLCYLYFGEMQSLVDDFAVDTPGGDQDRQWSVTAADAWTGVSALCLSANLFLAAYFARMGDRYCQVAGLDQ